MTVPAGELPSQHPPQPWATRVAWVVLVISVTVTLASWRLAVSEFRDDHLAVSVTLLIAGLLVSLLVSGLVWAVIHTRQLAVQMAEKMSESQRQSEERWSMAMAGLGGGITDWNLQTGETLYSQRWHEMLGLAEGSVGNRPEEWMTRVHPDDMTALTQRMHALLKEADDGVNHEFRMRHADGRWRWIRGHAIVSRDADGKPLRLIGTNLDITERKQAEITRDALLEAHADAGVGLLAIKNQRIVFANPAVAAISGYTLDELKAMPDVFSTLIHPTDREIVVSTHARRLSGEKTAARYEAAVVTKTGERRQVEMAVTFTPDSEDFQVIAIVIDITERQQLSARLQESHDMLAKISSQVPGVLFQFRLDADGHFHYPFISETVEDVYGVSAAAVREDAYILFQFLHPEDAEGITSSFEESARTLRLWHHEYRVVLPRLGVRWMLGDARPERLEDGSVVWHGISSDITERRAMEDALRASDERFRSLTHMGADWYWEQDADFRFTDISGGANYQEHLRDYMASAIGKTRWELAIGDMNAEEWRDHRTQLERHEPFRNFEFTRHGDDGRMRVISISGDPLFDRDGKFAGYRGVGSDITERKRVEEDLRLAAMVYENSSEAMSVTGADGRVITINPAFTLITGYEPEEVIGRHAKVFSIDQASFEAIKEAIDAIGHWHGEIWNKRKDGDVYPASITINTIFDKHRQPYRYVALFSDITNRKQTEELIWRQANFDALTQLFNRSMFHERVGQEIKKANRAGTQLALLFIDLDHFKEVNDTLGHDTGDHLLLEAARRIVSCVRETDAVARLGGDEFTVLLAGLDAGDAPIVERIAHDILDALVEPFRLGDEEVYVSASIGITLYPHDANDIDGLFRNADQAMYQSKSHGRNRYSYFTQALQESAQSRLRLITDLRGALAGDQFSVHFQPIVELASGRIVKAEALLRWNHPQRGLVLPGTFIALAEETGLIHDIGDWVFRQSAYWVQRWKSGGRGNFQVAVNKSPVQFHKDAAGHVEWLEHLTSLGLPGQSIAIEITEGVLLNADPGIAAALLGCRDAGIQVAIDDFGTGYSSLAYLNKFDIDYLKIDRSFIANLAPGSADMALSEAIIVMAHKLGLKVIAEGVETPQQRDLLAAVGCDYVQGYLFSRPLPPEEFEALLLKDARLI